MEGRVLFVSPNSGDARSVSRMLEPALIHCDPVSGCCEACVRLTEESYDAILTEAFLPDGDWKDLLTFTIHRGISCAFIVTHRFADDRFWAEVLNLGCYDMLAQPFDAREVQRILSLACSQTAARPLASPPLAARTISAAF
jgi:DNA-binding NtrC family response regulator